MHIKKHISIFLELTHSLHSRILYCHLTNLYSVQDYGLFHLPRAESVLRKKAESLKLPTTVKKEI